MGALLGTRCLPSQADALAAYYGGVPASVVPGPTSYVLRFELDGGTWKSVGYSVDGHGTWTRHYATSAPVLTFPECDAIEGLKDGMLIGWGVATAMICVAAVMYMKRGAR